MTSSDIYLEELERDALTELVNIGVSRAAASLRKMVGEQVFLSVPSLEVVSRATAATLIRERETGPLVAVRQDFDGAFSGQALLIFPQDNSLELVRAVAGEAMSEAEAAEMENEALAETGNVVLNSCLASMANMLKRPLTMSLPDVVRGVGAEFFQLGDDTGSKSVVLFLYINFAISERSIRGYIAMLMDLPSLEALKALIAEFIAQVVGEDPAATGAEPLGGPVPDNPQDALKQASGAWVWDAGAGFLFTDVRFANLCGLDPVAAAAGLPTSSFFAAIHPDDRLRVKIAVAGVLHGSETFQKDYRVRGADGETRWVSARGRCEVTDQGEVLGFNGVLSDITELKRLEEQLRVAQSAGGVGSFEHVDGFGTVVVSEQFCRLLGLRPASELPVRTINAVVHPDDPAIIRVAEDREGGASSYSELRISRADNGEERWLARRGEHRLDGGPQGARFIGVIYDITAAKQAEARLRDLAATLEQRVEERTRERDQVWRQARDLFFVVGADGIYRAVNPAWRTVLGYSTEDLIGSKRGLLTHPDQEGAAAAIFEGLQRGEPVENFDIQMRAADGSYRWINWTIVPEDGVFYGMGRDITDRRQLEEQLRQSQKMEAVGQLTGGLAHDFNNMLAGIMGGIDLARRRIAAGKEAEAGRFLDAAITGAERAAALTHRLLAFSRRQSLDARAVDVNLLVGSMEDMLRRTLGEQVELAVVLQAEAWRTRSDTNQLESAILNLAINARDAMPSGGKLTIETANVSLDHTHVALRDDMKPGDYLLVSVSDTGTGMPADVIAKVFDPFFTTKPLGQGTGLGLSMVYGFVHQSGGHVGIYSEPGLGTTVKLYLPRDDEAAPVQESLSANGEAPAGSGEAVLVVEDDAQVRMLVVSLLDDLGYQVLEASDGAAALKLIDAGKAVDLLITDVGLPGMNGRQLAEMARERRPNLPVLFVSGYAPNAAVRSEFLSHGMRLISKPFAMDVMARTLGEMLGRGPEEAG